MRETLSNFLVDLAVDPDQLRRFLLDPQADVDRWSQALTTQEKEAVLSGDADRIRRALGDDKGIPQHFKKKRAKKQTSKKQQRRRPARKRKGAR